MVAEAAGRRGIPTDAVGKRLRRGRLPGEKAGGSWLVVLDHSHSAQTIARFGRDPRRPVSRVEDTMVLPDYPTTPFLSMKRRVRRHIRCLRLRRGFRATPPPTARDG